MEELLNKLIEKGWKPFGESRIEEINRAEQYVGNWNWCCWGSKDAIQKRKSTRQLVSKESGLWQFVCDNHLYIYKMGESKNFIQDHFKNEYNECCYQYLYDKSCYEYYLLESALCNEEDLENFLLKNIKI